MTPGSSVQNTRLTSILRRGLAVRLWLENSSDAATKRDGSWRTDRNCSWPEPAVAADNPAAVTPAKVNDIAAARNAFQSCRRYASRQGGGCCTKTSLHDPMIPPASGSRVAFFSKLRGCDIVPRGRGRDWCALMARRLRHLRRRPSKPPGRHHECALCRGGSANVRFAPEASEVPRCRDRRDVPTADPCIVNGLLAEAKRVDHLGPFVGFRDV